MAQVLAFIHARLYVHCDIKASNVRIMEDGTIKLMDFGVMHQLGTPSPGRLKGTLEYMAPEWQRGANIDGRADLYSLGVMAYFLATRRLPFKRQSPAALLADHLTRPPPKPSTICPVDPALEEIILLLLAKDPRDRFQNAGELLEALCQRQRRAAARGAAVRARQLPARARGGGPRGGAGAADERAGRGRTGASRARCSWARPRAWASPGCSRSSSCRPSWRRSPSAWASAAPRAWRRWLRSPRRCAAWCR